MSDEFYCDVPNLKYFIQQVKSIIDSEGSVSQKLSGIRPHFSRMIEDSTWLPEEFRRVLEVGGMGAGIANWLLYKDTSGTLSMTALVVPPGAVTPVHDHLAWGIVGLYAGEQDEEIFALEHAVEEDTHHTNLKLVAKNHLTVGSLYELVPPADDIHRVITTSVEPSISLHLLTNDVGCVLRHRFVPETGEVAPFRSGYSNHECLIEGNGEKR